MKVQDLRDALASCERGYVVVTKAGEIAGVLQNQGDKTVTLQTLTEKKMAELKEKKGDKDAA